MHRDWLIPDWPAPAGVRAVCSTRAGGQSAGAFASLNLGNHVGDDPEIVTANRSAYAQALAVRPVFLHQVHGLDVVSINSQSPDGLMADACVTECPNVACTVMVADCLPVLICDAQGLRVAAAHAGWRGLAGVNGTGILERTCQQMLAENSACSSASDLMAWLGPCIGPKAFEVGDEVRDQFQSHDPAVAKLFQRHAPGKWLVDLAGLARTRLLAQGVHRIHGNDGTPAWCTVSQAQRYFSYRRDRISGRMAASIWRMA